MITICTVTLLVNGICPVYKLPAVYKWILGVNNNGSVQGWSPAANTPVHTCMTQFEVQHQIRPHPTPWHSHDQKATVSNKALLPFSPKGSYMLTWHTSDLEGECHPSKPLLITPTLCTSTLTQCQNYRSAYIYTPLYKHMQIPLQGRYPYNDVHHLAPPPALAFGSGLSPHYIQRHGGSLSASALRDHPGFILLIGLISHSWKLMPSCQPGLQDWCILRSIHLTPLWAARPITRLLYQSEANLQQ